MKRITLLLSIIFVSSVSLIAQANPKKVSDSELANFAEAYKEVQDISQKSQNEMVKAIQEGGLDLERYNAIARAQQSGDKDLDVSAEEIEKLKTINEQLIAIDTETNKKLQKELSDSNLTQERYQEIIKLLQNDEQLQIKFRELMQS